MTVYRSGKGYSNQLTTNGDLLIRSGGANIRLPIGSEEQVLGESGGLPAWETASGGGSGGYTHPDSLRVNIPSISSPAAGDTVYCTDLDKVFFYTGNTWQVSGETIEVISASGYSFAYGEVGIYNTSATFIEKTIAASNKRVSGICVFDVNQLEYMTMANTGIWEVWLQDGVGSSAGYYFSTAAQAGRAGSLGVAPSTGSFAISLDNEASSGTLHTCSLFKPDWH